MDLRSRSPGGWRGGIVIVVGVFIGATLFQPAMAHVTRKLNHLVKHLDPRYINVGEAVPLADNSVTSAKIADNAVTSAKIAVDTITAADIATNGVGSDEIAADAVGSEEIATGAVGKPEIATDAVGTSEIDSGAVGADEIDGSSVGSSEIATDAVGAAEVNLVAGTTVVSDMIDGGGEGNGSFDTALVTVSCAGGQEIIGVSADWGGASVNPMTTSPSPFTGDDELHIVESRRIDIDSWSVIGGNDSGENWFLHVTPLCLG
jgi:hypothetical protein